MDLTFHPNNLPSITSGSSNSFFASGVFDAEPAPLYPADPFGKIVGAKRSTRGGIYGFRFTDFGRIDCYYTYPVKSDPNHSTVLIHMPK